MKYKTINLLLLTCLLFTACQSGKKDYDASGSFEAIERLIPAEATGVIRVLNIQEGQTVQVGDTLGYVDVANLALQADQMEAAISSINAKVNDPEPQIMVYTAQLKTQQSQVAATEQQMANLDQEITRFQNLVNANAAPRKQLDDLLAQKRVLDKQLEGATAQLAVLQAQIRSARRQVAIQNRSIRSETEPNQKQLELIRKQMSDGIIISQHSGTITTQMAYDGEFTTLGRALYKLAQLDEMTLRAYITGDQLAQVKLQQVVTVRIDDGKGGFQQDEGTISWISDKAEFTPKTIQTKEERANLVYAIKVKVNNDGRYKMGMYGEIIF